MLEYGWGNPGEVLISGETPGQQHGQAAGQVLDHYQQSLPAGNFFPSAVPLYLHPELSTSTNKLEALYPLPSPWQPSSLSGILPGLPYHLPAPKAEECEYPPHIGLNLGGRTYFSSSSEDDFLSRLYRRWKSDLVPMNSPRCQAEECMADLAHAKHYHRRHKVCELHSKAATVVAAGLTQRFCQQCSRFHLLSEFDQGKRSCRKRLADHNRRRRKSQPHQSHSGNNGSSPPVSAPTSKSSSRSGGASRSSSITIAVSPRRTALDCFWSGRQEAASSSATSSSIVSPPAKFSPLNCGRIWEDRH